MDLPKDTQQERLFYIEMLALFTGQVSRKDLVTRFGISEPAATKDFSLYAEFAPDILRYDLRQKCYVLAETKPFFHHDIDQTLFSLAGERAIGLNTDHAKRLESWVNFSIKRPLDMSVTSTITRCLFQKRTVEAEYFSITSGSLRRELSPMALVHDGLRWHVRCFDHAKQQFRDYSLTRFKSAQVGAHSAVSQADDREWNTEVQLKLVPHPKLEHPEAIKIDYGMDEGHKVVPLKACIAGYFLRHWPIDYSDNADGNPQEKQLYLANKQELIDLGVSSWAFS